MKTTVNQRIESIISTLKISRNSFADKLGVAGSVIYNIVNGRNKPSFDLLAKIVLSFDISTEYLITGEGDMFMQKTTNENVTNSVTPLSQTNENSIETEGKNTLNKHNGNTLAKGMASLMLNKYNEKNGTDFKYALFADLISTFNSIGTYTQYLVWSMEKNIDIMMIEPIDIGNDITASPIYKKFEEILDEYIAIYNELKEAADKGMLTMDSIQRLWSQLRKRIDQSKSSSR